MIDIVSYRRSLSPEQITDVMIEMGSAPPTFQGGALAFSTICHNEPGEGSQKLYYYPSSSMFTCFSGCHDTFDIFQVLIQATYIQDGEEITIIDALEKIEAITGTEAPDLHTNQEDLGVSSGLINYLTRLDEAASLSVDPLPQIGEHALDNYLHLYPKDWQDEFISIETMKKFEIAYDPVSVSIVIPHRDSDGRLIGIRGRALEKPVQQLKGKYRPLFFGHILYNHPISFNLYGLNHNKENIRKTKKAILSEGEKGVLQLEEYLGNNNIGVASCGSNIALRQINLLKNNGCEEVVIGFDKQYREYGDEEYQIFKKAMTKHFQKLSQFMKVSVIVDKKGVLGYKESPFDRGFDVFQQLYKERIKDINEL